MLWITQVSCTHTPQHNTNKRVHRAAASHTHVPCIREVRRWSTTMHHTHTFTTGSHTVAPRSMHRKQQHAAHVPHSQLTVFRHHVGHVPTRHSLLY
jgi:hypothetical protein